MNHSEVTESVASRLEELGYKAKLLEDNVVGSAASGLRFYIRTNDTDIQFRCAMKIDGETAHWLEFANEFNLNTRFIKVYVLEENTLIAESDWWFDSSNDSETDNFKPAVELWELSLAELKNRLWTKNTKETSSDYTHCTEMT